MDIDNHAKIVIENTTCEIHNQNPSVSYVKGNIQIRSCCPNFKIRCLKTVIKILADQNNIKQVLFVNQTQS